MWVIIDLRPPLTNLSHSTATATPGSTKQRIEKFLLFFHPRLYLLLQSTKQKSNTIRRLEKSSRNIFFFFHLCTIPSHEALCSAFVLCVWFHASPLLLSRLSNAWHSQILLSDSAHLVNSMIVTVRPLDAWFFRKMSLKTQFSSFWPNQFSSSFNTLYHWPKL